MPASLTNIACLMAANVNLRAEIGSKPWPPS